jgi:hypothetical protein
VSARYFERFASLSSIDILDFYPGHLACFAGTTKLAEAGWTHNTRYLLIWISRISRDSITVQEIDFIAGTSDIKLESTNPERERF